MRIVDTLKQFSVKENSRYPEYHDTTIALSFDKSADDSRR